MKGIKQTEPKVLKSFAQLLGTEINNWKLEIPEEFGKGYCLGFVFNEHIRMLLFNYKLHENLVIENPEINEMARVILFKFQNIFPETGSLPEDTPSRTAPSVLIATRSLNTDIIIPVHTNTATINIEVDVQYLRGLFELPDQSHLLQNLLENTQPLLFEQMIYPSLQKIVDEIVSDSSNKIFKLFFLRLKAEELVCRLLMELEKRDMKQIYTLNTNDIERIYQVKNQMLESLDRPPLIKELARAASMSPTKLKNLFKQIFGNSIFNYYQEFRMKEASRLLKQGNLSVSEVGYRLGFSNLSHFSKVFASHIGIKPKQYSKMYVDKTSLKI